ncbi:MAG: antibiotic biosynthesis monooxygenase [Chloroflexota bacterium]|nr:antibiotic biosynthesis monooxygenase [Chloroflexota bacterium]
METIQTNAPVTWIISRQCVAGKEADYERWIAGISSEMQHLPGYEGINVIRPGSSNDEYVLILRFDTYDHLRLWEQSDVRKTWLTKLEPLTRGETKTQVLTGMEYWFTLPNQGMAMPPRYKMVLLSWLGLFPMSLVVSLFLQDILAIMVLPVRVAITNLFLLALMTYVVMPRLTRLFKRWLYG